MPQYHQDRSFPTTRLTQDSLQGGAGSRHGAGLEKELAENRKQECSLNFSDHLCNFKEKKKQREKKENFKRHVAIVYKPTCKVVILVKMPGKTLDNSHESDPKAFCRIRRQVKIKAKNCEIKFTYHSSKAEYAMRMAGDEMILLGVQLSGLDQRNRVVGRVVLPYSP